MNFKEYGELLKFIKENHGFPLRGKCIKYIDISTDMRDGKIFGITLRGVGNNEKHFRIMKKEDIQNIYNWLEDK